MRTSDTAKTDIGPFVREHRQKSVLAVALILFLFIATSSFCFMQCATTSRNSLVECFAALGVAGVFFGALVLIKYLSSGLYLFDTFTIVSATFLLVFYFAPVMRFSQGVVSRFGVNITSYCLQGTLVAVGAYFMFVIFHEFAAKNTLSPKRRNSAFYSSLSNEKQQLVGRVGFVLWLVSMFLVIANKLIAGYSLAYIFSLGTAENVSEELSGSNLSFLSYLRFTAITSWLAYFVYGKSKLLKAVMFALLTLYLLSGGNRMVVLVLFLCPFVYYFTSRASSPRASSLLMFLAALVVLFAVMQVARYNLHLGRVVDLSGESFESLFSPFYAEIDDFMAYYALFDTVPESHEFLFGSQMVGYSLVLLIPRAIWPAKPSPPVHDIITLSLGREAARAGVAYPCLGEYYVEFGVIGCLVCMAIMGYVCKKLRNLYLYGGSSSLALLTYAVVYPALFQFVIRGYMPQNFTMTLFLLIPILVFWLVTKGERLPSKRTVARVTRGQHA